MKTEYHSLSAERPDAAVIERAAAVLRAGGLVAFPTETVYGLAADAENETAVRRVFEAKGRPADNPLIVHIDSAAMLHRTARVIPTEAGTLAAAFWPGPLTMVLQRVPTIPDVVTAGLDTVAVRMPKHPVALQLITALGRGLVGPSANLSGRPSPTHGTDVLSDLDGKIDMILDAGATEIGVESTVLDMTVHPPAILRLGGLPQQDIERVIGPVGRISKGELLKRSPGTRHRHYAPHARVVLIAEGNGEGLESQLRTAKESGLVAGCILHSLTAQPDPQTHVVSITGGTVRFARAMFRAMRELDRKGVQIILIESVPDVGLGAAVMDRLRRAAAQ